MQFNLNQAIIINFGKIKTNYSGYFVNYYFNFKLNSMGLTVGWKRIGSSLNINLKFMIFNAIIK